MLESAGGIFASRKCAQRTFRPSSRLAFFAAGIAASSPAQAPSAGGTVWRLTATSGARSAAGVRSQRCRKHVAFPDRAAAAAGAAPFAVTGKAAVDVPASVSHCFRRSLQLGRYAP